MREGMTEASKNQSPDEHLKILKKRATAQVFLLNFFLRETMEIGNGADGKNIFVDLKV